jgi:hypothetical protein
MVRRPLPPVGGQVLAAVQVRLQVWQPVDQDSSRLRGKLTCDVGDGRKG